MNDDDLLEQKMYLAWVITCTRCKTERIVDHPDDLMKAIGVVIAEGWATELVENTMKHIMAPFIDTSSWPDQVTKVYCPQCMGERR